MKNKERDIILRNPTNKKHYTLIEEIRIKTTQVSVRVKQGKNDQELNIDIVCTTSRLARVAYIAINPA